MRTYILLLSTFVVFSSASTLSADPVSVTYSVTGTSGNYTLDFTFTNNEAGTDQDIYFVGLYFNPSLGLSMVAASPGSFDPTVYPTYTVSGLGGSDTIYDAVWLDPTISDLVPGQSLSGFDVQLATAVAPEAVPWFALSTGTVPYTGAGSFTNDPFNPGFEGVATPEPAAWILAAISLCAVFPLRARKQVRRAA